MTEPENQSPQPNNDGGGEKGQPKGNEPQHGGGTKSGGEPGTPHKTEGAPADARVIPTTYNLTLPKDSTLDEGYVHELADFAKSNKLTNGEAQSILEREHNLKATIIEGQQEELAEAMEEWNASAKSDSEIGGDNYDESTILAKRVVDQFGTPALKKALNDTGLGNHPELIRIMNRVGKHLKDDALVHANTESTGKSRSPEEVFYPGSSKENK